MALIDRIDRLFGERRATEQSFVDAPKDWMIEIFGGRSSAGVAVTANTAMKFGAVFACVRIIAETIGSLPLPVYRRLEGGMKEKAADHPLYAVLHDRPNPEQTAMEFREMQQGHLTLRGNCFAQIVRNGAGRVKELWPIHPDRVRVRRVNGSLVYTVGPSAQAMNAGTGPTLTQQVSLSAEDVLHIRGLSSDGVMGLSPVQVASEAIGLALAQQEFNARFFSNNASPNGILKHPANLNPDTRKAIKQSIDEQTRGLSRSHRWMLLEGGLEWTQVGLSMRDAQFIQGAQLSIRDIARIFRVPPHKIGDLEQATFSNIEQQAIEFVTDSIRPWAVRWEQASANKLLTEQERNAGYFVEMNLEGLLRGDIQSRYQAYAIGRQWGWLSADDIRERESLNALPDGQGKVYLMPMNMTTPDRLPDPDAEPAKEPEPKVDDEPDDDEDRAARALLTELARDAAARALRRELAEIRREAPKLASKPKEWRDWLRAFYAGHVEHLVTSLKLTPDEARSYAEARRAQLLERGVGVLEQWEMAGVDTLVMLLMRRTGQPVPEEVAR